VGLDDLRPREPDRERLEALFRRLEFTRLLEALGEEAGASASPRVEAADRAIEVWIVSEHRELHRLVDELRRLECIALEAVGLFGGPMAEAPVGLAVALGEARAAYLPVGPQRLDEPASLPLSDVIEALAEVLDGTRPWLACDSKGVQALFAECGVELPLPSFDPELAAFLLDPAAARTPAALAARFLDRRLESWEEIAGRGAKAIAPSDLPRSVLSEWAARHVCSLSPLRARLAPRLEQDGLQTLFEEVELPLTAVLARMERAGVRVQEAVLERLSKEYQRELDRIQAKVYELAGERFQIASPKQLQSILFEKLRLPVIRKTKTGYSTDEAVLEQLAHDHELPRWVLAHRRLAKLKNTYVDALPPLVNPKTGRIHPTFHQTGAATGRLSAANPNVQNIPIRTEEGVRIREAFVPAEGKVLLSADYSQVELRILAHFSEDESLLEAFEAGEDVLRRTAAAVLGIAPEAVTPEQRARAKAINFGIVYGSTAFGIANQLGIAAADAQAMIDAYFARYHGVRSFLDRTVADARASGYVRTLLGRRRYLPDLGSRNRVQRNAAERMAVNTVIQGSEADLIKKAMVDVDRELRRAAPDARMILQVHDELVLEVPEKSVDPVSERVRRCMETVYPLRAPLRVDLGVGRSWREAH
jgi:DNA polymerase-1